jgi:hypothetical protein
MTVDAWTLVNDHGGSDALVLRDVFEAALPLVAPGAPFYCASPAGSKGFTFSGDHRGGLAVPPGVAG